MDSPVGILIYGRDLALLDTRRMVLAAAGYNVKAASELSQVNRILAADPVDLLILCHTLSEAECEGVFAGRELHRLRVLALTAGGRSGCQARQRIIGMADAMDGPGKLLSTVKGLVCRECNAS